MNRRSLLLACASTLAVAGGCTDDGKTENTDNQNDGTDDTHTDGYTSEVRTDGSEDEGDINTTTNISTHIEEYWQIRVFVANTVPHDATVVHAKEDDLTDFEILKEVLEKANREYDPEMKDELDENEPYYLQSPLVERKLAPEDARSVEDVLGRERSHSSFEWYVEFEGTVFVIRLYLSVP
ncbi:hypothetical protein [Halococcoides cellulosivorans]|uniref:hypothetical protein n=1 Tax=Halococcoides cellulosivorans TaxID=1679096 RepID=UPI00131F2175|nr:hypothetical protein [Halococcoides cellulosivorans]